jgi:hypothetical protein
MWLQLKRLLNERVCILPNILRQNSACSQHSMGIHRALICDQPQQNPGLLCSQATITSHAIITRLLHSSSRAFELLLELSSASNMMLQNTAGRRSAGVHSEDVYGVQEAKKSSGSSVHAAAVQNDQLECSS